MQRRIHKGFHNPRISLKEPAVDFQHAEVAGALWQ